MHDDILRLDAGILLASHVPSSVGQVSSPSQWKVRVLTLPVIVMNGGRRLGRRSYAGATDQRAVPH